MASTVVSLAILLGTVFVVSSASPTVDMMHMPKSAANRQRVSTVSMHREQPQAHVAKAPPGYQWINPETRKERSIWRDPPPGGRYVPPPDNQPVLVNARVWGAHEREDESKWTWDLPEISKSTGMNPSNCGPMGQVKGVKTEPTNMWPDADIGWGRSRTMQQSTLQDTHFRAAEQNKWFAAYGSQDDNVFVGQIHQTRRKGEPGRRINWGCHQHSSVNDHGSNTYFKGRGNANVTTGDEVTRVSKRVHGREAEVWPLHGTKTENPHHNSLMQRASSLIAKVPENARAYLFS